MRFGLLLSGSHSVPAGVELAVFAERLGFDDLWVADEKFFRDPYISLAAVAGRTSRIRLGTGVTDPYARHPALTAMALASLEELAPGRVVLGIGAGGSGFPAMAIARRKPAAAVREAIELMRGLWRGDVVTLQGEVVSFANGRLNFTPPRHDIPVYVAARGRHMLRLAGEIADGVIIAPYASPPGLRYALELIATGARRAGRALRDLDTVARVDVCIAPDRTTALAAVKRWIALPLWSSYPNWDYLAPLPQPRVPDPVAEILAERDYGRIEEAAQYIPDEFVEHLVVAGTLDDVLRQTRAIAETGVTQITIHPVPLGDLHERELIEMFVASVMPALRDLTAAAAS
jgi:5,10-methylenetetrahydromethanopterin reductase